MQKCEGWTVTSRLGPRWFTWRVGEWSADPETTAEVECLAGHGLSVLLTRTGPGLTIVEPLNEVMAYAAASWAIPATEVRGEPPRLPIPPVDPDVVY